VQKRLEPPKIINVRVETKTTRATISWTTTKSVPCTLKVERLGMERFSGVSRGMRHSEIVRGLLPGKEYSFTIEAGIIGTGSDSYSGTFKTERR
ncbi:MAG: fibronectin type III domain-containing protein, partial [Methanomicrobia archaeon]|nr:fibronectin type III domain-containing protein [Methanomicrobia archaeon]